MLDIFQKNARIEQLDGLHFYEQDIVMLQYKYTGDVIIEIQVQYNMPGFGVVFSSTSQGLTEEDEAPKSLLAKIGSNDYSIYQKRFGTQTRIFLNACPLTPDKQVHTFRFEKTGTYLYCYELKEKDKTEIGRKNTGVDLSEFYIGIYGNKGNTIRHMDIYDNRPQFWFTNIKNTNGGRISFEQDQFKVERAEHSAEIEQEDIPLKKGRYYLDFKHDPVDNLYESKYFIFPSTEDKIHAEEKNMLRYDSTLTTIPYFDMDVDGNINLLFQTNSARIYDISIKDDPRQDYVSTDDTSKEKPGSYILLHLDDIVQADWDGVVDEVPHTNLEEQKPYSIFSYAGRILSLEESMIHLKESYHYRFRKEKNSWILTIQDKDKKEIYRYTYNANNKDARIFDDISGMITSFIITQSNGKQVDILHQATIFKYVPIDIESPIIVTDEHDLPLDLSASYRILPDGMYYFTPWEREVFAAQEKLELAHEINTNGDIYLYGIHGSYDESKFYNITDSSKIYDITAATTRFDQISDALFEIQNNQVLALNYEIQQRGYDYYIVDYLKLDSYAINKSSDHTQYVVEISSQAAKLNTIYDMTENGQIRTYKIEKKLNPSDDSYLVLRKGE